jgi:hypothetical protein
MKTLTAKRLLKAFKTGSSLPGLVETETGDYIVKWNGSGEGTVGSAVDWITTRLAERFAIPTAPHALISVEEDFTEQTNYDEMRDIIAGSVGINLGVGFIPDAKPYRPQDAQWLEPSLKELVFLFDVLVLNTDRTVENPNIILADTEPYFLDFSAAFEVRGAVLNRHFDETTLLPILKEHPFYSNNISLRAFSSSRQTLEHIVNSVPDGWLLASTDKQKSLERLEGILHGSLGILQRRLAVLRGLPAPDPEAKRLRALENRKRLGL